MANEKLNEILDLVRAVFNIAFDLITKDEIDEADVANLVQAIKALRD